VGEEGKRKKAFSEGEKLRPSSVCDRRTRAPSYHSRHGWMGGEKTDSRLALKTDESKRGN
jgi:hypothetical protein